MPLLEHSLNDGFIHNWLVAGPAKLPVAGPKNSNRDDWASWKEQVFASLPSEAVQLPMHPMERERFDCAGQSLAWRYVRCYEDHLVHANAFCPVWETVVTWAYTGVQTKGNGRATFELTTRGRADVWVNETLVFQKKTMTDALQTSPFIVELEKENEIWVRWLTVAGGPVENQLALRLSLMEEGETESIKVVTPVKAKFPYRVKKLEEAFDKAYLQELVAYKGVHINLAWAKNATEELTYAYHVQDAEARNYVEGTMPVESGKTVDVGHPQRIFERPLQVVLRAPGKEYWEQDTRYQRSMPVYAIDNAYSSVPQKEYGSRRVEALKDAARREPSLFSEIAKMALDQWDKVEPKWIHAAIERVKRLEVSSVLELIGLLGMVKRYGVAEAFPKHLLAAFEEATVQFRYSEEEPGEDAMRFQGESEEILFATAAVLAGQLYPERTFSRSGLRGSQLREHGEAAALNWLRERGISGFADWDSNLTFEWNLVALSHLAALAENTGLVDLAVTVMDKLLFLMALNSIRGVNGTTHGRTGAVMLKSGQLDSLSGLSYLLWGMGTLNSQIAGTVSLVLAEYEYPAFFAEIAASKEEELISREYHAGTGVEVNKVLYRTPDYLLSSAQNFRAGEKGQGEHIWQATMGPEAVVFTNHPGSMSEDEACLAGFWRGNGRLPRVAQWKDSLMAVYNLPDSEWIDFTHAYFPVPSFEESLIENGWAIARTGGAYIAITSSRSFEWVDRAPDTYRELRAQGRQCTWVCLMGRQAVDGSFEDFKNKVLNLKLTWQPLGVEFKSLRGEVLSFGWEGTLDVDGRPQPVDGFKHIENPYTSTERNSPVMDIAFGELLMRLNFA